MMLVICGLGIAISVYHIVKICYKEYKSRRMIWYGIQLIDYMYILMDYNEDYPENQLNLAEIMVSRRKAMWCFWRWGYKFFIKDKKALARILEYVDECNKEEEEDGKD